MLILSISVQLQILSTLWSCNIPMTMINYSGTLCSVLAWFIAPADQDTWLSALLLGWFLIKCKQKWPFDKVELLLRPHPHWICPFFCVGRMWKAFSRLFNSYLKCRRSLKCGQTATATNCNALIFIDLTAFMKIHWHRPFIVQSAIGGRKEKGHLFIGRCTPHNNFRLNDVSKMHRQICAPQLQPK